MYLTILTKAVTTSSDSYNILPTGLPAKSPYPLQPAVCTAADSKSYVPMVAYEALNDLPPLLPT